MVYVGLSVGIDVGMFRVAPALMSGVGITVYVGWGVPVPGRVGTGTFFVCVGVGAAVVGVAVGKKAVGTGIDGFCVYTFPATLDSVDAAGVGLVGICVPEPGRVGSGGGIGESVGAVGRGVGA